MISINRVLPRHLRLNTSQLRALPQERSDALRSIIEQAGCRLDIRLVQVVDIAWHPMRTGLQVTMRCALPPGMGSPVGMIATIHRFDTTAPVPLPEWLLEFQVANGVQVMGS